MCNSEMPTVVEKNFVAIWQLVNQDQAIIIHTKIMEVGLRKIKSANTTNMIA